MIAAPVKPASSSTAGSSAAREPDAVSPRVVGVGTATPTTAYSQQDILELFGVEDKRTRLMFLSSSIGRRFLTLPPAGPEGGPAAEPQGALLRKHRDSALDIGAQALRACLARAGAGWDDIRYLCCVTSTGLLTPGISALLCEKLNLRQDCARLDIVGMGCNAGLNGLNAVAAWTRANPGQLGVMLCVEICSAAYVFDGTLRTAVVNSLFGDGAAAVALRTGAAGGPEWPGIRGFASHIAPQGIDAMRFDWDDAHGKFNFFLARDVPYFVGAQVEQVVDRLLEQRQLRRRDIAHWIVHSGGKKVIDSIKINLDLTAHDLRHTTGVLRDYGNVSSGSFLFSFERLIDEGCASPGDYGVMMTMGPGATIETALIQW